MTIKLRKHITQEAVEATAKIYADASHEMRKAVDEVKFEYFLGKKIGIVEAFATLTGMQWVEADLMLTKRAAPFMEKT